MTISVNFVRSQAGKDPVRTWLRSMPSEDRKIIGGHIRQLQDNWPVGAPLCKPLVSKSSVNLYELRTRTTRLKSVRILFTVEDGCVVLLNGFAKKQDLVPFEEIRLACKRLNEHRVAALLA